MALDKANDGMPERAAVVIIGGGCVGLSIAHSLARLGVSEIVLVERQLLLGSESTGLGAGGVRQQFGTAISIKLSVESLDIFNNFERETGSPLDFRPVGYLFLAPTDALWEQFRKHVALQQSLGVDSELISAAEVRERYPFLETSDLRGASFCAADGVTDPHEVTQGYAKAVRKMGVTILVKSEAVGIAVENGGVAGVRLGSGTIRAPVAVIAAGAWSRQVAATAGVDLPVSPLCRACFVTDEVAELPVEIPFTIDSGAGFWMRGESGGVLMGIPRAEETPGFNTDVGWELWTRVAEYGIRRAPVLSRARLKRSWAGLYEMTPDNHPILGRTPECEGLYIAAGFSGHGFMHAPAAGKHVAELISRGESSLDISMLSIERFRTGRLVKENIWV